MNSMNHELKKAHVNAPEEIDKLDVREALYLNMSDDERVILLEAARQDLGVDDFYDELRQAAFDNYYDGETDREQWMEEAWQVGYDDYVSFLATTKTHPLHLAAAFDNVPWAIELLDAGADLNATDSEGKRPLDFATDKTAITLRSFQARISLGAIADHHRDSDLASPDEYLARRNRGRAL